ncbi:hypothetical protein KKC87_00230 [Patescibacteria group bacterium]|nr:hypothetical protein [Patescibacteria group bacterium]
MIEFLLLANFVFMKKMFIGNKFKISNIPISIFLISIVVISQFLISNIALSAPDIDTMSKNIATKSGYGATTATTLSETVGTLIKTVLSLVGVIFLILTIYAGVLWMTAGGNEENVTKARKILTFAVTGLIIILAAYSITWFVVEALTGATSGTAVGGAAPATDDPCMGFWYHYSHTNCW